MPLLLLKLMLPFGRLSGIPSRQKVNGPPVNAPPKGSFKVTRTLLEKLKQPTKSLIALPIAKPANPSS